MVGSNMKDNESMEKKEIKLCKNCRHCVPQTFLFGLISTMGDSVGAGPNCQRTIEEHVSPVDGTKWRSEPTRCLFERIPGFLSNNCGPDGKFYEEAARGTP